MLAILVAKEGFYLQIIADSIEYWWRHGADIYTALFQDSKVSYTFTVLFVFPLLTSKLNSYQMSG